jgi:hypothetical protein
MNEGNMLGETFDDIYLTPEGGSSKRGRLPAQF